MEYIPLKTQQLARAPLINPWVPLPGSVTGVKDTKKMLTTVFFSGKACVAFHSFGSSVRSMYPLKNNPTRGMGHDSGGNKSDVGLFREHEVRDACVQTDPGVSGAWDYASHGPTVANQIKGKYPCLSLQQLT